MDEFMSLKDSDAASSNPIEESINTVATNSEIMVEVEDDSSEDEDDTWVVVVKKGKKLTSKVWQSFDIVKCKDKLAARCQNCKKKLSYRSCGGTGHLLRHMEISCPKRPLNLSSGDKDGPATSVPTPKPKKPVFDQQVSRNELVKMVVIHEYPLSIVDHIGFRNFVKSLNEEFKMISRNTLRSDILKMYGNERDSLKAFLEHNEGRIAITTDMWTASNQKKGYMAVTSHFIDQDWNLHNRTLRFCFVPTPHTKGVLAQVLMECLSHYSLENKISSIVIDNCSTNDAMIDVLKEKLESSSLILGGEFLHMRCSAHVLNLIVQDGLDIIGRAISKVRECVVFWMATPKRIEKFDEACRLLIVTKSKKIGIDCKTRWNSTFLMLQCSLPFKEVFNRLKRLNKNSKKLKCVDVPSDEDWTLAALICQKLEIFYRATNIFSIRKHPTANLFFRIICEIRLALTRWVETEDNVVIKAMAKGMIEKFDKYWSHVNGILAIATILDPRNKMDRVVHYFKKIYGDDANVELQRIRTILDSIVLEYQMKNGKMNEELHMRGGSNEVSDDEDDFARAKRRKVRAAPMKSEVDQYLKSNTLPENSEFDVLNWWKRDQMYPTLQKIAKDILVIPVSSVASESAFSMGGRVVSAHRSKLHSQTVEALMCLQSWLVDDARGTFEGTNACSTISEDCDDDVAPMDIIDMDLDDVIEDED